MQSESRGDGPWVVLQARGGGQTCRKAHLQHAHSRPGMTAVTLPPSRYAASACPVEIVQHNIFLPSQRFKGTFTKVGAACLRSCIAAASSQGHCSVQGVVIPFWARAAGARPDPPLAPHTPPDMCGCSLPRGTRAPSAAGAHVAAGGSTHQLRSGQPQSCFAARRANVLQSACANVPLPRACPLFAHCQQLLPDTPGSLLLAPVDMELRLYERRRDGGTRSRLVSSVRFSELEVRGPHTRSASQPQLPRTRACSCLLRRQHAAGYQERDRSLTGGGPPHHATILRCLRMPPWHALHWRTRSLRVCEWTCLRLPLPPTWPRRWATVREGLAAPPQPRHRRSGPHHLQAPTMIARAAAWAGAATAAP